MYHSTFPIISSSHDALPSTCSDHHTLAPSGQRLPHLPTETLTPTYCACFRPPVRIRSAPSPSQYSPVCSTTGRLEKLVTPAIYVVLDIVESTDKMFIPGNVCAKEVNRRGHKKTPIKQAKNSRTAQPKMVASLFGGTRDMAEDRVEL